jgi:hypothetical protein
MDLIVLSYGGHNAYLVIVDVASCFALSLDLPNFLERSPTAHPDNFYEKNWPELPRDTYGPR